MTIAVIKNLIGNDYCAPGEIWKNESGSIVRKGPEFPDDVDDCSVWVSVNIGPKNEESSDIFQFHFVTYGYLNGWNQKSQERFITLEKFSWEDAIAELNRIVNECNDGDWDEFIKNICHFGYWEFENHKS